MFMPFTSDVIMLAVGFSVSYWLLMSAESYEDRLKRIGEILAWTLIVATAFFTVGNFLSAISIMSERHYTPVNGPNAPSGQTIMNEGEIPQAPAGTAGPAAPPGPQGQPGGMQQQTSSEPVGGGHPIKSTGSGPFGTE